MKRSNPPVLLILPTRALMDEFRASQLLLERIDLTLEALAEYFLDQWAQLEVEGGGLQHLLQLSVAELVLMHAYSDFLDHSEIIRRLDQDDLHATQLVMQAFGRALCSTVFDLLNDLQLSHGQMRSLHAQHWLGPDLVLSIDDP